MCLKAAIFDVDGTLTDSVHLHAKAWQETFQNFGQTIPFAEIRAQIGKGGDQLMPVLLSQDELKSKGKEIELYRGDLFKREFLKKVKPFAKVRELFREHRFPLSQGRECYEGNREVSSVRMGSGVAKLATGGKGLSPRKSAQVRSDRGLIGKSLKLYA